MVRKHANPLLHYTNQSAGLLPTAFGSRNTPKILIGRKLDPVWILRPEFHGSIVTRRGNQDVVWQGIWKGLTREYVLKQILGAFEDKAAGRLATLRCSG